jgi:hemolysin-activating ACP:hemolysin acyltransferase
MKLGQGMIEQTEQPNSGLEGQFTPQQMGAAVSKLVSASIGDIAVVFSHSAAHKHYTFADLEWMILPAVLSGQAYIAELQHTEIGARAPVAVVLWARVSDETDRRLSAEPARRIRLRPDEWASGEILWIVDTAGEARALAGALTKLAQTHLKGQTVKLVMPGPDGKPHVADLHTLLASASGGAGAA